MKRINHLEPRRIGMDVAHVPMSKLIDMARRVKTHTGKNIIGRKPTVREMYQMMSDEGANGGVTK